MTQGPDFTNLGQISQRKVTYDTDNMPTQVWASQSGVTTYFSYDGDGGRVKKTTTGGAVIYYVGDHYEVKDNEPLKYIFAGNLRLIMIKGANTFYYHKDHLGSTSVMTDNNGTIVETAQYEPFGATRDHTGQDMSGYKFTDQELDNETNLYNYDARLYDPVIGRFVTADSIMQNAYDPQSFNPYAYCRNNPLIYADPNGNVWDYFGGGNWLTAKWTGSETGYYHPSATSIYAFDGVEQVVKGNYTNKVNAFGTGLQIISGFFDFDIPGDIRDITYDVTNGEWGKLPMDAIGFLPVIGALKYGDEASALLKNSLKWTSYGGKHISPKNVPWKDIISGTLKGPAKYKYGINIESLERSIWGNGKPATNGKPWKVMEFTDEIGASGGKPSRWAIVESSGDTIHGHPITEDEYNNLLK